MKIENPIKRSNASLREKYERLYHHFGRSIVTRDECFTFGQDVYGVRGAVIPLRRQPYCKTDKKAVYRLDRLLKIHGIPLNPEFELETQNFLRQQGLKALESFESVKEDKLGWLLLHESLRWTPSVGQKIIDS